MNRGVEGVPEGDPLRQISVEFLDGELRKLHMRCDRWRGSDQIVPPVAGAVGGRVNAGSVG